jgi:DNA-3-methyladenine glycosylase II
MSASLDITPLTEKTYQQTITALCARDADLADVVSTYGIPPFWIQSPGFAGIVAAILAQQVSLESAQAAFAKLEQSIGSITPEGFLSLDNDTLKTIGFSRQKAAYAHEIARRVVTGAFDFAILESMGNDASRKCLVELRGVGQWTADTYLLFSLRRRDAWPVGDLALEKAVQELRGLTSTPSSEELNEIADNWRPLRAVAARILWYHYLCRRDRYVSA